MSCVKTLAGIWVSVGLPLYTVHHFPSQCSGNSRFSRCLPRWAQQWDMLVVIHHTISLLLSVMVPGLWFMHKISAEYTRKKSLLSICLVCMHEVWLHKTIYPYVCVYNFVITYTAYLYINTTRTRRIRIYIYIYIYISKTILWLLLCHAVYVISSTERKCCDRQ